MVLIDTKGQEAAIKNCSEKQYDNTSNISVYGITTCREILDKANSFKTKKHTISAQQSMLYGVKSLILDFIIKFVLLLQIVSWQHKVKNVII